VSARRSLRRKVVAVRRRLRRVTDPMILFPGMAVLVLALIWTATLVVARNDIENARRLTARAAIDTAQTYEAHVLRALREIDQTLRIVRFAHEKRGADEALRELARHDLLPTDLVFTVRISDGHGRTVSGPKHGDWSSVWKQEFSPAGQHTDALAASRPYLDGETGEWLMHFGRRLLSPADVLPGFAVVSVDPAFFVSGYDRTVMGHDGVIALVGADDGVVRVRRIDDEIHYGENIDYERLVSEGLDAGVANSSTFTPWDDVRRFTVVRELYGQSLAVVVGLSENEQLEQAYRRRSLYLVVGALASVLGVVVLAALGRMAVQLQRSQARIMEARAARTQRVEHLAYHDTLTGLPNRSLFGELLTQAVRQAHRYGRKLSVLYLDLDGFKPINDRLGHEAGDRLLMAIADRLRSCVRESDTVARVGGDEFIVLVPIVGNSGDVDLIANKILSAISEPFRLNAREVHVTCSVGIACFPEHGHDEETLVRNADLAMYAAKQEGPNRWRFHDPETGEA